MKKLNSKKNILVLGGLLLIGFLALSAFVNNPNDKIIGTWVNEEDSHFKLEFKTNGKCYWYYTGENTKLYTYTIHDFSDSLSSSIEFCGKNVSAGNTENYYLKLVDAENDSLCYEIYGLTNDVLSLNYLGTSKIIVFNKQ